MVLHATNLAGFILSTFLSSSGYFICETQISKTKCIGICKSNPSCGRQESRRSQRVNTPLLRSGNRVQGLPRGFIPVIGRLRLKIKSRLPLNLSSSKKKMGSISNAAHLSVNLKGCVISPGISVQYSFLNSGLTCNKLLLTFYSG